MHVELLRYALKKCKLKKLPLVLFLGCAEGALNFIADARAEARARANARADATAYATAYFTYKIAT